MLSDEIKEKLLEGIQQKITHFNVPQQQAWVIAANIIVAIIGRAGGKTHGFIAPAAIRNVKGMPRGATGFVGPTYIKLENDLVPALCKALEKFGFYEGVDYWVKQYIPKNIKHEIALEQPRNPQYSIFFKNGHVFRLIGLDRKDSGNAQSNDFIINDEAKFTNQEAFDLRIVPTNRGNEDIFGHLSYHHGIMYCSDMPTSPESQWLLEYEKLMDQEQIDLIVSYDQEERQLISQMAEKILEENPGTSQQVKFDKEVLLATMRDLVTKGQLTEALDKRFRKELQRLEGILYELRREAVLFIEASTLDNIDVVTERYLRQMKKVLSPDVFDTSILGLRKSGADFGFYGNFDEVRHTYTDINYNYTDQFAGTNKLPQPWMKDNDIDITRGFDIACDWGAKINCMEIGQEFKHVFKIVNSLEVKHPYLIKDLVKKFDNYYKGYPVKRIVHHYDHTAIFMDATRERNYYQELEAQFKAIGWTVENHYIGAAHSHEARYTMWSRVYGGGDPDTKPVMINRINCENLIKATQDAGVYENDKGHKKDKRTERSTKILPEHSTHHTDAKDTLYYGVFKNRIGDAIYEPDYTM